MKSMLGRMKKLAGTFWSRRRSFCSESEGQSHGTPRDIVTKLNAAFNAGLVSPQVSARFAALNIQAHQNTPEEFSAYVQGQMELWGRVVKEANIELG
jgi:hypothetical protein